MDRPICEACGEAFDPYYICLKDPLSKTEISIKHDAFTRGWPGTDCFEEELETPQFCFDCMSDILFNPFMLGEEEVNEEIE